MHKQRPGKGKAQPDSVVNAGGKHVDVVPFTPPKFDVKDPAAYQYVSLIHLLFTKYYNLFVILSYTSYYFLLFFLFTENCRYLEDNGYVVFANVATQEEITHGYELFWKFMNHSFPKVLRDNVSTWGKENWPKWGETGVCFYNLCVYLEKNC